MAITNKNVETKTIKVTRAHNVEKDGKTTTFFDMTINGVTVYGCRFMSGSKGDFIAFPSYKSGDKYYNYVWCQISDAETKEIETQIKTLLNFE